MKKIFLTFFICFSLNIVAQEQLPKGWEKVYLDDKEAYMNLTTGNIVFTKPKGAAIRVAKKVYQQSTITTTIHNVEEGETLYAIARKYNIPVSTIYKLNEGINYNTLKVGQEIVIINSENSNDNNNLYIVEKGETLYSISKKYNLTVAELKKINNLTSNQISIGQRIKVQY